MRKRIAVLPGDGIGPEVVKQGVRLLDSLSEALDMTFEFTDYLIGGACLNAHGVPVQESTIQACQQADAVLLGAVGSPEFDDNPPHLRPEKALLGMRAALGVYCNLRPARLYNALAAASPLKADIVDGIDMLVVRELTGGIYFGESAGIVSENGEEVGRNTMIYSETEIRRIAHQAFQFAQKRRGHLTSVDKANVLSVSQLWRRVLNDVATEYPHVKLSHMLVDNCAMQLVRNPRQFDVIVTGNLFGDILSDEASVLTGSIGMLPSASLGDGAPLYEPVHGSAPDIAGTGKANPLAMMASIAMLVQYTFDRADVAASIEAAIEAVLEAGYHTADLQVENGTLVGTEEMGQLVIDKVAEMLAVATEI